MNDPMCRVTIQCADEPRAVDLALPRYAQLGLLVPDIVGLVVDDGPATGPPQGWRLHRLTGDRCDEALSLHDIGVRDGDVIVLSPDSGPAPGPLYSNPFSSVAASAPDRPHADVAAAAWTVSGLAVAVAVAFSGSGGGAPLTGAVIALMAAAVCLTVGHRTANLSAQLAGVGFSCTAAFLVVPGAPGWSHLMLTAAVGCACSVAVMRSSVGDTRWLGAVATGSALLGAVTAAGVLLGLDIAALGAVLAVVSSAVLGASGRLAVGLSGLRPVPGVPELRLTRARDLLVALVTGTSVAAAAASAFVMAGGLRGDAAWPPAAALTAVLGALLVSRVRLYADPRCGAAVGWCGLACAGSTLALLTVSTPKHVGWLAVSVLAVAAWGAARGRPVNPVFSRVVDIAEYILLAAVVPLACWVGGGYDLVRSASLT